MYIRRKVFSVLNVEGEEKLFSTNEIRPSLDDYNSHRGLGRALITAIPTAGGSLIGGYAAKRAAESADSEGLSDREILRKSKNAAGTVGAISGAALGALTGRSVAGTLAGAGLGYLTGRWAGGKNTETRLGKRRRALDPRAI